ncbi:hypothetical protein ACEWY4_019272 [Coilia grayii]|uniref:Integrase catalytic domain-containing protein n=1 Tax=Coilia grayii TaxID=363190 RepID=A0ABD1JFN2_9TELE
MKQVYSLLGIKGIRTTPYHPQTDGMVERFNQTLKAMLRKFVSDTGADWDQWLPYLLFAYREVPQATGYSPFELLYGRQVRGPLDVLREAWMGEGPATPTNIVSYVLKMRDKLEELSSLAHNNKEQAQSSQKSWYDRTARSRTFNTGQKVLLLLPTSESSLLAKWQGPAGDMMWARAVAEEELREQYFPTAGGGATCPPIDHLSSHHQAELQRIIPEGLFREEPGRTSVISHDIQLTSPGRIRQTSFRVPARLIPALKDEVQSMLEMGVIVPSRSQWCSPVVLVPKKDGGLRFCVDFSKLNAIKPQVSKVDAVRSCLPPSMKKGVRSFLGLVGWYCRFLPDFATRAAPLTNLTRKSSPNKVVWTEDCDKAFQDLKESLCRSPVLQSPDFDLPFTVQTNASGVGLGAVLLQGEGEDRRPVLYISRKLFPRETRYSTVEKDCLAIKWAVDTLKYYLMGKEFVLETAHRALQWLNRMRDSNARVTRWYLSLQPYKFSVEYKPGKHNVTADFLSRLYEEGQA